MTDKKMEETTYYRFMSEIRAFLSKLLKDPIKAEPSKYLKDRDFTRKKLIKELISRSVLERHEKILDSTNSDEKTPKYTVTFKVRKKDFETRIHRLYIKYFEKNEPEKDKKDVNESVFANEEDMKKKIMNSPDGKVYKERGGIKECEAADLGGTSSFSVGAETSRGDMGFDVVAGTVHGGEIYAPKGKKHKKNDILGKTITAEKKKPRRVYITEEQYKMLMEIGTGSVGAMGDYTANGLVLKTSDGKEDPCAKAGKIKVKTVMKEGNKKLGPPKEATNSPEAQKHYGDCKTAYVKLKGNAQVQEPDCEGNHPRGDERTVYLGGPNDKTMKGQLKEATDCENAWETECWIDIPFGDSSYFEDKTEFVRKDPSFQTPFGKVAVTIQGSKEDKDQLKADGGKDLKRDDDRLRKQNVLYSNRWMK